MASSLRSIGISTSGFRGRHFEIGRRPTSGNVGQCRQCRIQVGLSRKCGGRSRNRIFISSHSEVIAAFVFSAAILDFRWKETSDFPVDGTVEKPVPENGGGGRHRIRISSWSVGEVRGGVQSCTPPLFALQNRARCSRVNVP